MDKQRMISFERRIAQRFDAGEIPYLTHLSGGNEEQLIEIFSEIKRGDWIFSTHRSHYHYLLAGGSEDVLEDMIVNGRSMFVFDKQLNFYSSSIVAATPSIAAGVAWALKREGSNRRVWCFIGDGAEDEGHFYEAVRYVDGWELPCTFVIEDNDRSVSASKAERRGKSEFEWPDCVRRYCYTPTYPHGGTGSGKWIQFCREATLAEHPEKHSCELPPPKAFGPPMKYKDAIKQSMEMLANAGAVFVGYNVRHGSAYETLKGIPESQRLETPLAENLMAGLAMGMALEGIRPVLFFERHDFIFNAIDALVNQLDKISTLSGGQFSMPVIIKAVVGGVKPFYAGLTHTQDLTSLFREIFSFPVYAPQTSGEMLEAYKIAMSAKTPVLVSEKKDLYENEFNK